MQQILWMIFNAGLCIRSTRSYRHGRGWLGCHGTQERLVTKLFFKKGKDILYIQTLWEFKKK